MFLTEKILGIVVKTKDDSYALALSAFNISHDIAIGAKEHEVRILKAQVEELASQLKYEKARADALVDRLLEQKAHVAAVAPIAAHVAKHQDEKATAELQRLKVVFDELNSIGGDIPAMPPGSERAFDMAGGTAVSR